MKKVCICTIFSMLLSVAVFAMGSNDAARSTDPSGSGSAPAKEQILVLGAMNDFKGNLEAGSLIFDSILLLGMDRQIQPAAVEAWEIHNEHTEFVLHLRKGLMYSDGTAASAHDLKKSIEVFGKAHVRSYSKKLKTIEVLNDSSVKVVMTVPYLFLLQELEKVPLVPAKYLQEDASITEYIGSGPYMLTEYEKDIKAELIKNPNYWEKKPYSITKVVWKVLPDGDARKLALQSGQVDVIGLTEHHISIPLTASYELHTGKTFGMLKQDPKTYGIVFSLGFNYKKGFLTDRILRAALEHAINRKILIEKLFLGEAESCEYLFNPLFDDGPKNKPPFVYDLQKAKDMLTKAGYGWQNGALIKDGKQVTLHYVCSSNAQQKDIAVFIQNELKALGIAVTIEALNGPLVAEKLKKGEYDLCYTVSWFEPVITALAFSGLNSAHHGMGIGFGINAEAIKTAEKILTASDMAAFNKAIDEYWTIQWEECPILPLYTQTRSAFYKKGITGLTFSGSIFKIDLAHVQWAK